MKDQYKELQNAGNTYRKTLDHSFDVSKISDDAVWKMFEKYAEGQDQVEKQDQVEQKARKAGWYQKYRRLSRPMQFVAAVVALVLASVVSVAAYDGIVQLVNYVRYQGELRTAVGHGYEDGEGSEQQIGQVQECGNIQVTFDSMIALQDQIYFTITFQTKDGSALFISTEDDISFRRQMELMDIYIDNGEHQYRINNYDFNRIDDYSDVSKAQFELLYKKPGNMNNSDQPSIETDLAGRDLKLLIGDIQYEVGHKKEIGFTYENAAKLLSDLDQQPVMNFATEVNNVAIESYSFVETAVGQASPCLQLVYRIPDQSYIDEVLSYGFFNQKTGLIVTAQKKNSLIKRKVEYDYEYEDGLLTIKYYPRMIDGATADEILSFTEQLESYTMIRCLKNTTEKVEGSWSFPFSVESMDINKLYEMDQDIAIEDASFHLEKIIVGDGRLMIVSTPNTEVKEVSIATDPQAVFRQSKVLEVFEKAFFDPEQSSLIMEDGTEYPLKRDVGQMSGTSYNSTTMEFTCDIKFLKLIDSDKVTAVRIADQVIELR